MKIHVETERLLLREFEPSDETNMFELDSNPEVHTYLGNKPITTIDEALNNINYIINQYARNGIGRWAAIEKSSGHFIGWGGLKFVDDRTYNNRTNYYDMGYRLIPRFWGKGYATEIGKASVAYGFNTMKLDTIYATAHVDNTASRNALVKSGMQFVEYFREGDMQIAWYEMHKP